MAEQDIPSASDALLVLLRELEKHQTTSQISLLLFRELEKHLSPAELLRILAPLQGFTKTDINEILGEKQHG